MQRSVSFRRSIRKDQTYLTKKNFRVFDRDGRRVDPSSIDWASASPRGFPYQIVQAPGPDNALGLVKFMFPNKHLVYLHDTPSRALFQRTERAFSSGCIRLRNPLELADLLLDGGDEWSRERIDQTIESGQTRTVFLPRKIPVLLLYWTVELDPAGNVRFFRDLYDRDKAVLDALDGDFRPRPPTIEGRS